MSNLIAKEYRGVEQIKHTDELGNEYWSTRELATVLGYSKWENFSKVIDRAMLACRNTGFSITDKFAEVSKTKTKTMFYLKILVKSWFRQKN